MIRKNEVFPIGKIIKPHGINGELSFSFTTDVFDREDAEFFIIEMDGILVPFYIESYRFRSDTTALLKLEDIDNEEQARELSGQTLYLPNSFLEKMNESDFTLDYFIGFTITDSHAGTLGTITAVDDSTENVLFIVDHNGDELLIPANDDFITQIDSENQTMHMQLPEGLIGL